MFSVSHFAAVMLREAFRKAASGRKCSICGMVVAHAFYQRHQETCRIDENDSDVIFVDKVSTSCGTSTKCERMEPLEAQLNTTVPRKPVTLEPENSCSTAGGCGEAKQSRSNDNVSVAETSNKTSSTTKDLKHLEVKTCSSIESPSVCSVEKTNIEEIVKENVTNRSRYLLRNRQAKNYVSTIKSEPILQRQTAISGKECGLKERHVSLRSIGKRSSSPSLSYPDCKSARRNSSNNLVCGLEPTQAFRILIERIDTLLRDYRWRLQSVSQSSQDISSPDTEDNSSVPSVSLSQQGSSNNIVSQATSLTISPEVPYYQNQSQSVGVHYSLELFWKITLKVLRYGNNEATAVNLWGAANIGYLLKLFTCQIDTQQLFIKILLRGRKWLTLNKLKFSNLTFVINDVYKELLTQALLEEVSNDTKNVGISLQECLHLLNAPELAQLCRKFKIAHTQRRALLIDQLLKVSMQKNVYGLSIGENILQCAIGILGTLHRIPLHIHRLCSVIFTLYSPVTMDSAALIDEPFKNLQRQLLYELLQMKIHVLSLPAPNANDVHGISIYSEFTEVEYYVEAKFTEEQLLEWMSKNKYEKVIKMGTELRPKLINDHFQNEIRMHYYKNLPVHLRRFTAMAVLIRCLGHYADALQKLRMYNEATDLFEFLIMKKAEWYDRLALIYDVHLKKKDRALDVCLNAIMDDDVKEVGVLALQSRAQKLLPKNDPLLQLRVEPIEAELVFVEGNIVGKNLGDQRQNHFYLSSQDVCGTESIDACSVEMVALDYFLRKRGFNEGIHAEGSIWHTIFGLICYDVIFDHNVNDVWLSDVQRCPCDLNCSSFYTNRRDKFEEIYAQILADKNFEWVYVQILKAWQKSPQENSEISWNLFRDISHIMGFLTCCGLELIVAVFQRIAENYRQNRSGFPDLTMWNTKEKSLAVVEVKGPNDRLSNKQRMWLDFFIRNGVDALICHVTAKNRRLLK